MLSITNHRRKEVPVTSSTLVIGAGIAGIQAALQVAEAGHKVCLIEQKQYIGGNTKFDKTFPL